ncbi:MAG: S8 family serine peptidase [Marinoscillum sp.]
MAIYQGELYVKFQTNSSKLDASRPQLQLDNILGLKNYYTLSKSSDPRQSSSIDGLFHVFVDSDTDIRALCDQLEIFQNVVYAEPIYQEQLLYTPNDPAIGEGNQYYLETIRAFEAWDITNGSNEIIIGISDTGFDRDHQDIKSKLYRNENDPPNGIDDDGNGYIDDYIGYDFADNDSIAEADASHHGTRVGGIAGASTDDGIGMAGIGFNTLISPLKVFKSSNNNSSSAYESVLYAADNGFDIINLSWGSPDSYSQAAQNIINYAVQEKGLIVIAAAGNTPEDLAFYPASYDNVLSVGATEPDDNKASFSTFNYNIDMTAPGRQIYSAQGSNTYGIDGGTSYSSPIVAGTAALLKHHFPELTPNQIIERLRVSSLPIYEVGSNVSYQDKLGFGRLDMYNALVNNTLKSIRFSNLEYANEIGNFAYFGDSISISADFTNYLNPSSATLEFTSTSPFITLLDQHVSLGNLQTLAQKHVEAPILFIHEETPPETNIDVKVNITDGSYKDFQYFTIVTQPDRVDIKNENISYTVTGNGNLAFGSDGFQNGLGLNWKNQIYAGRVSFMIGLNSESVSDNFYKRTASTTREQDFIKIGNAKIQSHPAMDLVSANTFKDDSAANPLNLVVSQKTMTNLSANYLIQEYLITSLSGSSLENLSSGLYVDWNIQDASKNKSYYNDSLKLLVSYDAQSSTFAGLYAYYDSAPISQSLDISNKNSNTPDLGGDLTDDLKYQLSKIKQYDSAGWVGAGNDIAVMISDESIKINQGNSSKNAFIMVFGSSLGELKSTLDQAIVAYEEYLGLPSLLETVISCEGASVVLDPLKGNNYLFYSDPYGKNLLGQGNAFISGQVNQDTSFYVINVDKGYEDDIQRIDVNLVSQVANFKMSSDTLFLDNPSNSVSFTDQSFKPLNWLWDFGNGIQSTIQHPKVSFSTPGTYEIVLSVENELGCNESFSKNLLVAQRPSKPDISDQTICFGESIVLIASNTDELAVYSDNTSKTPLYSGSSLAFTKLEKDTILYVSNTTGPFESLRKQVIIRVDDFFADFEVVPATDSDEISAHVINQSSGFVTSNWYVDGSFASSTDTLTISVSKSSYSISLATTGTSGCKDSTTQVITFQDSPIPTIDLGTFCYGDDAILNPSNGNIFGFYTDAELSQLILKGESLTVSQLEEETKVYVVGLDSILPSSPVEVVLTPFLPFVEITSDPDTLILTKQKTASFEINNENISSWKWYINDQLVDSSPKPVFFFDTASIYKVTLIAIDETGCKNSDTLQYLVLNAPIVDALGIELHKTKVYPLPAEDYLNIESEIFTHARLHSLSGKLLKSQTFSGKVSLDTEGLESGVYLLELSDQYGSNQWIKVILR